jgi:hypothetical protein
MNTQAVHPQNGTRGRDRKPRKTADKPNVLITAYNRPDKLERLLNSLNPEEVGQVYIHCDGPSKDKPQDADLVSSTRSVAERFAADNSATVFRQPSNLGCREGMHFAIDWFFHDFERGIILEDDLILSRSAVRFFSHFLSTNADPRVWMISGNKQSPFRSRARAGLSTIPHIWGWATWSARWREHDRELAFWPQFRSSKEFAAIFPSHAIARAFRSEIDSAFRRDIDAWDLGWMATMWHNRALSISPPVNLVSNWGFDSQATHTRTENFEAKKAIEEIRGHEYKLSSQPNKIADLLELTALKGTPRQRLLLRRVARDYERRFQT